MLIGSSEFRAEYVKHKMEETLTELMLMWSAREIFHQWYIYNSQNVARNTLLSKRAKNIAVGSEKLNNRIANQSQSREARNLDAGRVALDIRIFRSLAQCHRGLTFTAAYKRNNGWKSVFRINMDHAFSI